MARRKQNAVPGADTPPGHTAGSGNKEARAVVTPARHSATHVPCFLILTIIPQGHSITPLLSTRKPRLRADQQLA